MEDGKKHTETPGRRTTVAPIRTPRLRLVPQDAALATAEAVSYAAMAARLGADLPPAWPPPLMATMRGHYAAPLTADPHLTGWLLWYWLLRRAGQPPLLIGMGGFRGKPRAGGSVEIGYAVVPAHQRRGYATEAVAALVGWAFQQDGVAQIVAETMPDLAASQRVLQKLGFVGPEPGTEATVPRYYLSR